MSGFAAIADRIAESMRSGIPPWRKPWVGIPANPCTNQKYRGINILRLDTTAIEKSYRSPWWATIKQWNLLDCTVKKRPDGVPEGQWATSITRLDANNKPSTVLVFNAEQVFGLDAKKWKIVVEKEPDYDRVENVIRATKAEFHWGYKTPKYRRPPHDVICMPMPSSFNGVCQFVATQLHELVHWCEWRTGWSGSYEQGELIAEIATGMLESELEIPHCGDMTNHDKYLKTWLECIGENPQYLIQAVNQATKAVQFILN